MTSLQTFHLFPDFPPEIRRRIWAFAHDVYAPRAYFVCIKLDPTERTYQQMTIHHMAPESVQFRPYPDPAQTLGNTWALKLACHESRKEVAHAWNTFKPEKIMRMGLRNGEGKPSKVIPYEMRGASYGLSVVIDGARDLVIVEGWRIFDSQLSRVTAVGSLKVPKPGEVSRYFGLSALKHIAVSHERGIPVSWYAYSLKRFKAAIPNLRVLYIYIIPGMLVDDKDELIPKGYLAADKRDSQNAPASFHARDRVFYELDPAKMESAGAIPSTFAALIKMNFWRKREADEGISIKFLSWEWIN
ncbi:hypothetical protein NW762_003689 [Fusarium torreyae]|uniref:2EXR domain-containing protein n=1 Tax=Fusarium torreyae TaxID=1237075 RepID=A0A9W8S988_9HYPO|nr:hypothetical protein NW762_003689 [Fusarium torreyae]